jgi:hypothetical protein
LQRGNDFSMALNEIEPNAVPQARRPDDFATAPSACAAPSNAEVLGGPVDAMLVFGRMKNSRKKWIGFGLAAIVVVFLGLWVSLAVSGLSRAPRIRGGVEIHAPGQTRVYSGNEFLGMGKVTIPWYDLQGEGKQAGAVIELSPMLASPLTARIGWRKLAG